MAVMISCRHSAPRINQTVAMRVDQRGSVMTASVDGESPAPEMLGLIRARRKNIADGRWRRGLTISMVDVCV